MSTQPHFEKGADTFQKTPHTESQQPQSAGDHSPTQFAGDIKPQWLNSPVSLRRCKYVYVCIGTLQQDPNNIQSIFNMSSSSFKTHLTAGI